MGKRAVNVAVDFVAWEEKGVLRTVRKLRITKEGRVEKEGEVWVWVKDSRKRISSRKGKTQRKLRLLRRRNGQKFVFENAKKGKGRRNTASFCFFYGHRKRRFLRIPCGHSRRT